MGLLCLCAYHVVFYAHVGCFLVTIGDEVCLVPWALFCYVAGRAPPSIVDEMEFRVQTCVGHMRLTNRTSDEVATFLKLVNSGPPNAFHPRPVFTSVKQVQEYGQELHAMVVDRLTRVHFRLLSLYRRMVRPRLQAHFLVAKEVARDVVSWVTGLHTGQQVAAACDATVARVRALFGVEDAPPPAVLTGLSSSRPAAHSTGSASTEGDEGEGVGAGGGGGGGDSVGSLVTSRRRSALHPGSFGADGLATLASIASGSGGGGGGVGGSTVSSMIAARRRSSVMPMTMSGQGQGQGAEGGALGGLGLLPSLASRPLSGPMAGGRRGTLMPGTLAASLAALQHVGGDAGGGAGPGGAGGSLASGTAGPGAGVDASGEAGAGGGAGGPSPRRRSSVKAAAVSSVLSEVGEDGSCLLPSALADSAKTKALRRRYEGYLTRQFALGVAACLQASCARVPACLLAACVPPGVVASVAEVSSLKAVWTLCKQVCAGVTESLTRALASLSTCVLGSGDAIANSLATGVLVQVTSALVPRPLSARESHRAPAVQWATGRLTRAGSPRLLLWARTRARFCAALSSGLAGARLPFALPPCPVPEAGLEVLRTAREHRARVVSAALHRIAGMVARAHSVFYGRARALVVPAVDALCLAVSATRVRAVRQHMWRLHLVLDRVDAVQVFVAGVRAAGLPLPRHVVPPPALCAAVSTVGTIAEVEHASVALAKWRVETLRRSRSVVRDACRAWVTTRRLQGGTWPHTRWCLQSSACHTHSLFHSRSLHPPLPPCMHSWLPLHTPSLLWRL